MEQYIKRDGKIYLQVIEEQEINLLELEQQKVFIQQEADKKKVRVQEQINAVKSIA